MSIEKLTQKLDHAQARFKDYVKECERLRKEKSHAYKQGYSSNGKKTILDQEAVDNYKSLAKEHAAAQGQKNYYKAKVKDYKAKIKRQQANQAKAKMRRDNNEDDAIPANIQRRENGKFDLNNRHYACKKESEQEEAKLEVIESVQVELDYSKHIEMLPETEQLAPIMLHKLVAMGDFRAIKYVHDKEERLLTLRNKQADIELKENQLRKENEDYALLVKIAHKLGLKADASMDMKALLEQMD